MLHHFPIKLVISITIVSLIFFSGCNIFESKSDDDLLEPSEIFEDGLTIYFFEISNTPDLRLMMRTNGEFNHYSIDFEVFDRNIDSEFTREVVIKGILTRPELPSSTPDVASAHISFTRIEGELNLLITDGSSTDSLKVNITEEKVDIISLQTNFTDVPYNRYYRRPPNSIYYSCSTLDTKKHMCQELHELMKDEANLQEFQFPDDGKIPYPETEKGMNFEYSAPIRYYLYDSSEDFRQAGQLLTDFADENNLSNEENWLYIVNWQEVAYSSYYMIF
ncbi:hypothetical protein [Rhodohalobacter sp. 8-1]|uniref:hypothetical protein n=1 Tax=Rhodohalobacter sp. 8-1 TaxID=3131972 RepID=UPI0030EC3191